VSVAAPPREIKTVLEEDTGAREDGTGEEGSGEEEVSTAGVVGRVVVAAGTVTGTDDALGPVLEVRGVAAVGSGV